MKQCLETSEQKHIYYYLMSIGRVLAHLTIVENIHAGKIVGYYCYIGDRPLENLRNIPISKDIKKAMEDVLWEIDLTAVEANLDESEVIINEIVEHFNCKNKNTVIDTEKGENQK